MGLAVLTSKSQSDDRTYEITRKKLDEIMATPLLATKLYIPPLRTNFIQRQRLRTMLDVGAQGKLTLISAPAGFGKTTLISEWLQQGKTQSAWLSLDEDDNEPARFLTYLIAAVQKLLPTVGQSLLVTLHSPQTPPVETLLTSLLNEITTATAQADLAHNKCFLVLDDYHLLTNSVIDDALAFLIDYLPPQLHLVITTREDPPLPLARMRARAQLTEIRAADLRFTPDEAATFLNQAMGLDLTAEEIAALEARTEGWIAGLQLAAVSMQGHLRGQQDRSNFIQSFTGSHRFVMDYLLEEVLHQQPAAIQTFLLHTAVLERMCGPLCEALLASPAGSGQATLELLEQANLFLVPLDSERRWYRYHHLFGELLRQRLQQQIATGDEETPSVEALHIRASVWYEANDHELEAFHHATLAQDYARAERLIEGNGMPLHFRGHIRPVLRWLDTLPPAVKDAYPSLWLAHASTLLATGLIVRTEEVLNAAERLLATKETAGSLDIAERDLVGRIAAIRATVAAGLQKRAVIISESQRALEFLHPENLAFRTSTNWKLGYAYHLGGDFAAAKVEYQEAIAKSQASGNKIFTIMSHIGLADIYLIETHLPLAAEHYQHAVTLYGEQPLPSASEAFSGLAQIYYEWNELDMAQTYAEQGIQLGRQWEDSDTPIRSEWMRARVLLARGEFARAAGSATATVNAMLEANFIRHLDNVLATLVMAMLAQDKLPEAAALVGQHEAPLCQARVHLAQGKLPCALTRLADTRQIMTERKQADKVLQVTVLQAVALQATGQTEEALQELGAALGQAEPSGYIRLFADEGAPMAQLLQQFLPNAATHGIDPNYVHKLLDAIAAKTMPMAAEYAQIDATQEQPLAEPLSDREIEVLALIAAGRKNQEIADALFVSLNTVRYHTKNIYGKLGVNKRTQAVARAQELGLL